jgi:hypothetical protein
MTYVHLINCLALMFGPPLVLYRSTKLYVPETKPHLSTYIFSGDFRAWTLCLYAAMGYIGVQLLKVTLISFFFFF